MTSTNKGWQTVATYDNDDGLGGGMNNSLQLKESPAVVSKVEIQVIAPATLPEGYEFDAVVGNTTIKVQVPQGGVEKGQSFPVSVTPDILRYGNNKETTADCVVIPTSDVVGTGATISIPVGHWRDGIFHCFRYGPCHPHCWTSFCCPLLAVAQVTSRLNLNWRGVAATSPGQSENAFFVMFIITVVHFVIIVATYIAIFTLDTNDYSQPVPINGWKQPIGIELFILHLHRFFKITYLVITARWLRMIRRVIRAKYAIPGENIMDLIAGYFCQCCAAAQMLRHTTDYNVYPSYTCSKTGLPDSVPFIV